MSISPGRDGRAPHRPGDTDTHASGATSGATSGNETDSPATLGDGTTGGPPETTGSDTTAGDTGGEPLSPGCVDYAALVTECYSAERGAAALELCSDYVQQLYGDQGAGCVTVYEDYLACLSALTCEMLTGGAPVCEAEDAAVDKACGPA